MSCKFFGFLMPSKGIRRLPVGLLHNKKALLYNLCIFGTNHQKRNEKMSFYEPHATCYVNDTIWKFFFQEVYKFSFR